MHGSTPQRPHLGLWHITSPSHGSSYPLRRMDSSWLVETLPCGTGVKRCIVPVSLDAMALIIHLNTSPMDRTAPMVIFTTLHGDTGWLVAALFVWGFELDWSIFSWIQSYIHVKWFSSTFLLLLFFLSFRALFAVVCSLSCALLSNVSFGIHGCSNVSCGIDCMHSMDVWLFWVCRMPHNREGWVLFSLLVGL